MINLISYSYIIAQNIVQVSLVMNVQGLNISLPVQINIPDLVEAAQTAGRVDWNVQSIISVSSTIVGSAVKPGG